MTKMTTIQLEKETVAELQSVKEYPNQTYNMLIERMVEVFVAVKKQDQYDKFLHQVQQQKMNELWDNKEDEGWEDA